MYFENVKEMVDYAGGDIENFNSFEFRYGAEEIVSYHIVRDLGSIEEINNTTFKFNGIIFDLNLVEPLC